MLWIKIQGFTINFKRKTKKIILEKNKFLNFFLQTIIIKCYLKTFLLRWGSELWIYILILTSFVYILFLSYINICGSGSRILIRIPNTDPDPEGSWIRIRIHNTAENANSNLLYRNEYKNVRHLDEFVIYKCWLNYIWV